MKPVSDGKRSEDDSFSRYYDPDFSKKEKRKDQGGSDQKGGKGYEELQINEASMSVKKNCWGLPEKKESSMSVLLTAVYLIAIHEEMGRMQEKKPVILMVPVNFKKDFSIGFDVEFLRLYRSPGYQFGEGKDSFEDVN